MQRHAISMEMSCRYSSPIWSCAARRPPSISDPRPVISSEKYLTCN
jgi:hypothetical protein